MSETLSVTIYPDNEGFITYECPYCESAFKLRVDDVNDEEWPIDDLFCPYCGLTDTIERFLSEDVVNEVKAQAYNYAVKMLNKQFGKMAKDIAYTRALDHLCVVKQAS